MAEEGRGVALAILGIVGVIGVVGLVLLFTGATAQVSAPFQKVYGGAIRGEEFPYLTDRSSGGFPSTASDPPLDSVYAPAGYYTEKPVPLELQEQAEFYGESKSGSDAFTTYNRQPYYTPSGQICAAGPSDPGFRCPQNTYCISDPGRAESGGWIPAPAHPCYQRASQQ